MEEDGNDRVQALEYRQKSAKKNVSSKEILEEDSKNVECGESVEESKLEDNHRLVFD
ncbi:11627_t:CDS:2 [Racocetra fulgida]|uniref:11627_t:CDS:1 n=1 Tax=Racocetra fulgida TaxID=60492 RepID=A0A9N9BB87_9GLOM|nr:11627_t:CDS:2 [Racocetra fulgida]